MKKIRTFLRQLFCLHEWRQIGSVVAEPDPHNHSFEIYYCRLECIKCGKEMHEIFKTADYIK